MDKTVSKFGDIKFRNCFVQSQILFTPRTRQDKTVLSCPCRRGIRQEDILPSACQRDHRNLTNFIVIIQTMGACTLGPGFYLKFYGICLCHIALWYFRVDSVVQCIGHATMTSMGSGVMRLFMTINHTLY